MNTIEVDGVTIDIVQDTPQRRVESIGNYRLTIRPRSGKYFFDVDFVIGDSRTFLDHVTNIPTLDEAIVQGRAKMIAAWREWEES